MPSGTDPRYGYTRRGFLAAATLVTAGCAAPTARRPAAGDDSAGTDGATSASTATAEAGPTRGTWPMGGYDPANTGYNPDATGPALPPTRQWEYDVDGIYTMSATALVDGDCYTGSEERVYALGPDGSEKWVVEVDDLAHEYATTVVDGTVLACTRGLEQARFGGPDPGSLWALDADSGETRWRTETHLTTGPVVDDGRIYLGNTTDEAGSLRAFALDDGATEWQYDVDCGGESAVLARPAVVEGVVYVAATCTDEDGDRAGRVLALDADSGERLWAAPVDDRVRAGPVALDGRIHLGTDGGTVVALDADSGERLWADAPGGSVPESPVAADGTLYVMSRDYLTAYDAESGERRWQAPDEDRRVTGLALTDDAVFAGGYHLTAHDAADGDLLFDQTIGGAGGAFGTPVVAGDCLYAGACIKQEDSQLYDNFVWSLA